jgi:hypothetical protein
VTRILQRWLAWHFAVWLGFAGLVGLHPWLHHWIEHGGAGPAHVHVHHFGDFAPAHSHRKAPSNNADDSDKAPHDPQRHEHHGLPQSLLEGLLALATPVVTPRPACLPAAAALRIPVLFFRSLRFDPQTAGRAPPPTIPVPRA